jgi:hypothetical protein
MQYAHRCPSMSLCRGNSQNHHHHQQQQLQLNLQLSTAAAANDYSFTAVVISNDHHH